MCRVAVIYSMTSSAMASSPGGMVRPSKLAVSALMTSSSFVACTTGRSVGLGALEDATGIGADLTIGIHHTRPVAQQPAGFGKFTQRIGPPEGIARR